MTIAKAAARLIAAIFRGETQHAHKFWALADQGIASATNFFLLIFLAWHTDAAQVGYYAVAMSAIVISSGLQDALITRPYTLEYFKTDLPREIYSGNALLFAASTAAICALAATGLGGLLFLVDAMPNFQALLSALAVALPATLLREFIRRYLLAEMALREMFAFDAASIIIMSALLMALARFSAIDAASTLVAMGAAYAMAVLSWLLLRRRRFAISPGRCAGCLAQWWRIGRWLVPGKMARDLQGYLTHWYSIVLLGAAATGAFAASLSILALSNPFIIGIVNIMTPRAVRALENRGIAGLRQQTLSDTILISVVMFGFAGLLAVYGDEIMMLVFRSDEYAGHGALLTTLGLSVAFASAASPAAIALATLDRARAESIVSMAICALEIVLIPILILSFGLLGAAIALLIGEIAGFVVRNAMLFAEFRKAGVIPRRHPKMANFGWRSIYRSYEKNA